MSIFTIFLNSSCAKPPIQKSSNQIVPMPPIQKLSKKVVQTSPIQSHCLVGSNASGISSLLIYFLHALRCLNLLHQFISLTWLIVSGSWFYKFLIYDFHFECYSSNVSNIFDSTKHLCINCELFFNIFI